MVEAPSALAAALASRSLRFQTSRALAPAFIQTLLRRRASSIEPDLPLSARMLSSLDTATEIRWDAQAAP
jgi:hypothetical protein